MCKSHLQLRWTPRPGTYPWTPQPAVALAKQSIQEGIIANLQVGGSSNQGRRSHLGSESPSHDPPGVPKHSRRKKSKGSSGGGPSRSSKSKGPDPLTENFPYSDPGSGHGNDEMRPNSVFKVYEEGNECDDLSRRIRAL
ncbi:hypothetical protein Acr_04g0001680 [Actinidia rufa]|uniref:Uncharacterized protein n=1 Tax=Actinidia rufa TaxID=165716 RepID=A0A7J0EGB4_9ERIC|nr:hypothetical protein Acr_04g0001680 [Actinidia rufa]